MRNRAESKERSKELRKERKIKLERRRSGMILENSIEFMEASLRGEEYPVLVSVERVKLR